MPGTTSSRPKWHPTSVWMHVQATAWLGLGGVIGVVVTVSVLPIDRAYMPGLPAATLDDSREGHPG